jgi:hypothetical protein|nr:MAG TPA: hypothetical protein [Caudoviricetes sp.]
MKETLKREDIERACGTVPEWLRRCWSDDATFVRKLEPLLKREWQHAEGGVVEHLLRRIASKISSARASSARRCKDLMWEQVLRGVESYARAYTELLGDGWDPEAEAQLEAAFRRVGKSLGDEELLQTLWDADQLKALGTLSEVRERGVMR